MHFYTSLPASPQLTALAHTLSRPGRSVRLLPLTELALARPQRLAPLRVERAELVKSLAFINWSLALLQNGTWQPDAALETALLEDQETLETRLLALTPLLAEQQEGGQPA